MGEKVQSLILADKQAKHDAEKKRKAQEEERKRLFEEKRKKAEDARKARKKDEEKDDEDVEEEKEAVDKQEDDARPELSEEEKQLWYRKLDIPDLGEKTLAKSFADFSLPTKDEGFDDISFAWQDESACSKFLKDWVLEKKLTQRVEDLQPGEWFREEWSKWQKSLQEWRKRHSDFKDPVKKKALLAKKKADAK